MTTVKQYRLPGGHEEITATIGELENQGYLGPPTKGETLQLSHVTSGKAGWHVENDGRLPGAQ